MSTISYDASRTALFSPGQRETLFSPGNTYTPTQIAMEMARLAYLRAEADASINIRLSAAIALAGFGEPTLFSDPTTGSYGFGCIHALNGDAFIAFRGTEPEDLSDVAHDLEAYQVVWNEAAGCVHAGFAKAARSLLPAITNWIREKQGLYATLTLTGHSLGGAIATLLAAVFNPTCLVTIGSPRVGDNSFAVCLAGVGHTRLVDCCDVVTELPPPLFGYTHICDATYIDRHGRVTVNPSNHQIELDRTEARRDYLIYFSWRIGNVALREFADHAPINYLRAYF